MLKEVWSEGVVLVDYSSPKLLDQLEQAMQLGTPAIVKVKDVGGSAGRRQKEWSDLSSNNIAIQFLVM